MYVHKKGKFKFFTSPRGDLRASIQLPIMFSVNKQSNDYIIIILISIIAVDAASVDQHYFFKSIFVSICSLFPRKNRRRVLMQCISPKKKTIKIEIPSRLVSC